jgi:hypothetical protein
MLHVTLHNNKNSSLYFDKYILYQNGFQMKVNVSMACILYEERYVYLHVYVNCIESTTTTEYFRFYFKCFLLSYGYSKSVKAINRFLGNGHYLCKII